MLRTAIAQNIFIAFLILLLTGLLFWGWDNGVRSAKSQTVLNDAHAITQGFEYFHTDQNRYPTTDEFSENNLMRTYIVNYPPQTFPTKICPTSFDYFSAGPQTYKLRICLPKAISGYKIGWNTIEK